MIHPMHIALVGVGTAAVLVTGVAPEADAAGLATGRPARAKTRLSVPDENPPDGNARCVVDVKHFPVVGNRQERSWLRFKFARLDRTEDYTIWIDDPATELLDFTRVAAFTTRHRGYARQRFDTKHGETLPFGATLLVLGGLACQVRDVDGLTVLSGHLPAIQ